MTSRSYYEPSDEDADDIDAPLQPDHFCDCHPGRELRHPHQHHPDCPRYAPPPRGPGSDARHRAAVLAEIRQRLADAKRRPTP
jgi:hypothetical protein